MANKKNGVELTSLAGSEISQVHTEYGGKQDSLVLVFSDRQSLRVAIDLVIPVGPEEWDDYWTDFDDFLEDGPDDVEPETVEGSVLTLAELLGRTVRGVRTGVGSAHSRYVMLDLGEDLSLLMPGRAAWLGTVAVADCSDFDRLLDTEVSAHIREEQTL